MNQPETSNTTTQSGAPPLETVQLASSIQPHGILLLLSNPELTILQVSANVATHLGIPPHNLLNQPLHSLLDQRWLQSIHEKLAHATGEFLHLPLRTFTGERFFYGTLQSTTDGILLELEPTPSELTDDVATTLLDVHVLVKGAIAQLRQTLHLTDFLHCATTAIQSITQFDRVLAYQFAPDGAGAVVAETKLADLPSYLGLHYPASDIPEPVRMLYRTGLLRFIPDLTAPAVALVPADNPQTHQPTNLHPSRLRGVDTCCIQYHQNMGVAAILIIPLVKGETLWGLISCHHRTPKSLSPALRDACELVGQFVGAELANKVDQAERDYMVRLRSLQAEFVASVAQVDDLREALVNPAPRLLDLVGATGAAVCLEDNITLVGTTPTLEQIPPLLEWAAEQVTDGLFHTTSLPKQYPKAADYQAIASGLLVLQISQIRRYYILWFRPEVLQTVNWAGDPREAVIIHTDGQLSPRTSFAQWQELVRATSLPWKDGEVENATGLRGAIVGIVLRKADELAYMNRELERRNRELDSFAYAASHDLKEPLRGIHNFSNLLLKGYGDVLDEMGRSRLQTLIRLSRRMESLIDALLKFSRLGQAELNYQPTDLNQLISRVLADLQVSRQIEHIDIRLPRSLPTVVCDPVLLTEVMTNLLSNACKYNDKPAQWIEIGYMENATPPSQANGQSLNLFPQPALYVRDNGIGIRARHHETIFRLFKRLHEQNLYGGGTGAGLTITRKIIERHRGHIWVESTYGEGSTFYFTLGTA